MTLLTGSVLEKDENIVGKGAIPGFQQLLLFA